MSTGEIHGIPGCGDNGNPGRGNTVLIGGMIGDLQNKCSVGPETSRPEVEKLAARVSFPREKGFIPQSDSCVAEAGGRGYTVRPRNEFRGLTVV